MSPELIVDKPERIPEALGRRFMEEARSAIEDRGRFAVALPGGSVATSCFPRLAATPVDGSRTEFFWADERAVPPTDPESNYGLARALWLEPASVDPARVHRMEADRRDLAGAADDYEGEMRRILGDGLRLDLAILGVGPDGHVCSLFPGHPLVHERRRWVAAVYDSPKPPARRLTLTLPALLATRAVVIVAAGSAKAAVVKAAVEDGASTLPVALVTRQAPRVILLLDSQAASLLMRP